MSGKSALEEWLCASRGAPPAADAPRGNRGGRAAGPLAADAAPPRRLLHQADLVYLYDGGFEGFLCCVYESFARHELPFAVWTPERETATLYPVKEIAADPALAARVFGSFAGRLGKEAERLIMNCFLSGREDKELRILRFLHLAYPQGPRVMALMGHPDVAPMYAMQKHLTREVEKLMGFLRFEESGGMLGAVIHPQNYVLPLLRGHFCARYPEEDFLIYDAAHGAALLYRDHQASLTELSAPLTLPPPDEKERYYQQLWKQFYKTLEVTPRHNERCRRTMCPKRYWADMTELREAL